MNSTLEILVNGELFSGWKSASFSTDMEALSSSFFVNARDDENVLADLQAGAVCKVYVINGNRKDTLLDGYIVRRSQSLSATSHDVSISGNDKLIDLVDCSAVRENRSWVKKRFSRIIKDLADPYGITVDVSDVTEDVVIERMTLQPGESSFDPIDRLCRSQAVLPLGTLDGSLKLTYAASETDRAFVDLVVGENVKDVSSETDWSERFSDYTVLGQAAGRGKRWTKEMLQGKGYATDETVTRHRPLLFIAENRSNSTELAKRAAWEAQIRAGRADEQRVTLQGWYQKDANGNIQGLWEKNKRVTLVVPDWNLNVDRLITSVSFSLDESGEQTVLGLRHPDIFKADPTAKVDLR